MPQRRTILYIGQLWQGGTCVERKKVLEGMGNVVIPYDTTPFQTLGSRLTRSIAHRFNFGRGISTLNEELLGFVNSLRTPITHVWIDKGKWISAATLKAIKRNTGALLVHYTPDPQLVYHRSRIFEAAIPEYDCLITTKEYELANYERLGAKRLLKTLQGFDPRFKHHTPSSEDMAAYHSDVTFVGHYEPHYASALKAVSATGVVLRIWGPGWPKYARGQAWAQKHVSGDGLWGPSYPMALSCAKIGLGLLSRLVPDTSTTRSFEIPAAGAMLVAEKTPEHAALYDEGREAVFFNDFADLAQLVSHYVSASEERATIARRGHDRCHSSGYSARHLLSSLLEQVDR